MAKRKLTVHSSATRADVQVEREHDLISLLIAPRDPAHAGWCHLEPRAVRELAKGLNDICDGMEPAGD